MRRLFAPALVLGVLVGCDEATGPDSEICSPLVSGYQLAVGDTLTLQQDPRIRYIEVEVGTGATVVANSAVEVNYTGYVLDTTCRFDSSVGRTTLPFTVGSGGLIRGFDLGVIGMKVGGVRRVLIPSQIAYPAGSRDQFGNPHPLAGLDLIFDIEMVSSR